MRYIIGNMIAHIIPIRYIAVKKKNVIVRNKLDNIGHQKTERALHGESQMYLHHSQKIQKKNTKMQKSNKKSKLKAARKMKS